MSKLYIKIFYLPKPALNFIEIKKRVLLLLIFTNFLNIVKNYCNLFPNVLYYNQGSCPINLSSFFQKAAFKTQMFLQKEERI